MTHCKNALVFVIIGFVTLALSDASIAQTEVIGFIEQDTTWAQANSPYVALGSIIVKKGVTLTIEPGVTVEFGPGHSLTIEGALVAKGTVKNRITFNSDKGWKGILFQDSSVDAQFDDANNYVKGSILQYCVLKSAGITAISASPMIDSCEIHNSATGISISEPEAVVVIRNSTVTVSAGGIGVSCRKAVITGNILRGNTIGEPMPIGR